MAEPFKWSNEPLNWGDWCAWCKEAKKEADRRKAAGDPIAQKPALFTHAATRKLITHYVGEDWFMRYAMPDGRANSYFLPKFTGADGEAADYTARVFNLAECFFNLQDVENFALPVRDLQNEPQIESALAELQIGMILHQDGIPFRYLEPSTVSGVKTPDLEITIGNRSVYSDVKCKFEIVDYADGCLKAPFKSARAQIGTGRQGFMFVKVPQNWSSQRGDEVIIPRAVVDECRRLMGGTSRVVKTVFYTFHLTQGPEAMTNRHAIAEINSPRLAADDAWNERVFPCDGRGSWLRLLEIVGNAVGEPV